MIFKIFEFILNHIQNPQYLCLAFVLAIILVGIVTYGYMRSVAIPSENDLAARKYESDNHRTIEIRKSEDLRATETLKSNNLRKVELAKLKHSHLQQTPGNRNNSPP